MLPKLFCERCGHDWIPRIEDPSMCPKCKSYKWNVPKDNKGTV